MSLGYRKKDVRAGLVAAGMSVFGIMVAKRAIYAFVMYVMVTGDTSNIELQRAYVANRKAEQDLDEREIYDDDARDRTFEGAYDKALAALQERSDDEVRAEFERYRKEEAQEEAEMEAFISDDGRKRTRIARYNTDKRMRSEQLPVFAAGYSKTYRQEFARAAELDGA